MPEKHLYEYAVIRFVPKVEREEFLNIGIVLFSKQARYLNAIYVLNEQKLRVFSTEVDMECLKNALQVFDKVCQGKKEGGSGIGLSIVKKILEDHGGKVWATSRLGIGTIMYFVLRKYQEVPMK